MGTQLPISVTIDLQLLRFLTKASPGKTSRTDAFLYLIQCQERLLEIDFEGGLKVPFLHVEMEQEDSYGVHGNAAKTWRYRDKKELERHARSHAQYYKNTAANG